MKNLIKLSCLLIVLILGSANVLKAQTYFSDDFENGKGKWITGGGNWDTLSSTYISANHCITDSRIGNYTYNSDPTITLSQPLNLSGATFPVLTFIHKFKLWAKGCSGQPVVYDYIYLEISTNGGFNWNQLKQWTVGSGWIHEQFDLRNYKSNLVKFRFRLSSHNPCGGVEDGWYIDDVRVEEFISTNPTLIFPFCDGFENGKSNWFSGWDTLSTNPNSGTFCIADSRTGNYSHNSDPTITLKGVFDLTNTVFPVVSFFHKYGLWAAGCSGQPVVYDYIYFEISTNGGFTWTQLRSWQGSNVTWTNELFDLTNYRTDKVKIRYRISSHNACIGNADGAYFDDFCISDFTPNYINLNLKVLFEGMYDPITDIMSMQDTVTVFLRNTTAPYTFRDTCKGVISPFTHSGQFYFHKPPTGNYHIVVRHRSTIETWSKPGGVHLVKGDGSVNNYDFTSSASQAYGGNQILKGSRYCIYSGDVDQDGIVDATDLGIVDNNASAGTEGYVKSDLNGDLLVDGSDLLIADNNAYNIVSVMRP
ncbi:MAG: hypothetical protein K1X85_03810 [Ignavibacteria bacterium]|nr:hypothetical protein [Ignavibacteria bacterium]